MGLTIRHKDLPAAFSRFTAAFFKRHWEDEHEVSGDVGDISSPLDLPGLQLWLDASQIAGHADGDRLALWPDLSGNGRDFVSFGQRQQVQLTLTGDLNSGECIVTVTAAGMTNSPKVFHISGGGVPWVTIRDALAEDDELTAFFELFADVPDRPFLYLTALVPAANDATMNIVLEQSTSNLTGTASQPHAGLSPSEVRPTFKVGVQNGLAGVLFEDTDPDFLSLVGDNLHMLDGWEGVTILLVGNEFEDTYYSALSASPEIGQLNPYFPVRLDFGAGNRLDFVTDIDDTGLDPGATHIEGTTPPSGTMQEHVPYWYMGSCDLLAGVMMVETSVAAFQAADNANHVGAFSNVGCRSITLGNGTSEVWNGFIYELIVWDRVLTLRERRLVKEYASTKWGTL